MKTKPNPRSRRRFLAALGSGLAALGFAPRAKAGTARAGTRPSAGFRRTPHVEAYYRTLED
ncbi:MAG: hypothetical protein D6708_06205 [Candidatus Dadabacteria bacterium]|nr:MAG: hypothetical protein D6708_06205 [Candidatus Dadabacteria bacterium]